MPDQLKAMSAAPDFHLRWWARILNRIPLASAARWRRLYLARSQFEWFRRSAAGSDLAVESDDLYLIIGEDTAQTGFDRHYLYHTAWAARVLRERGVERHIDISSSLYFAALVSGFIEVDFYDFRPPDLHLDRLAVKRGDLMNLPLQNESVKSISCMHVIEHIGLGRYGDELDPEGDRRALNEIARVLVPGGIFLLVVPVGRPRICFNAHRVYSFDAVMRRVEKSFRLEEFALIPETSDRGALMRHADPSLVAGAEYDCGCFLLVRQ